MNKINNKSTSYLILALSIVSFTLGGCVNKSKYQKALATIDSLKKENNKLNIQNEELLNGESRLINYINLYYRKNDYLKAYESLIKLKKHHPESNLLIQNNELFKKIETKGLLIIDSIKAIKEDSIKLANINELGDWRIGSFVNDFDEPTGNKYVYANFYGRFSNSATANDNLRIYVQIYGEKDNFNIIFNYDEYDNGTYEDEICEYTKIINKEKRKKYTNESLHSRFSCEGDNAYHSLEEILTEEGIYNFYIRLKYNTIYEFSINTNYLNNALIKAGLKSIQ